MNSNMDGYKGIPCIPANQPIGDMYVCVLDSAFLQKITYADVRRNESECRNVERYVGVQRVLDPKREKEISCYRYFNFREFCKYNQCPDRCKITWRKDRCFDR